MGYYDEDGHYHSFRQGVHKLADKVAQPGGQSYAQIDHNEMKNLASPHPVLSESTNASLANTVPIPCHHIRMGDFLMLQGRPCQVIRISTSSATGQYRYLGVDLFSKQLHEESSFISNPAPSVVVQTMLGPVFKQYRVLDMSDGVITAMTETGDVKSGLTVIDQSSLYSRLQNAFESGRGSVRVLVLSDNGQELAVDMKVFHLSEQSLSKEQIQLRTAIIEGKRPEIEEALGKVKEINEQDSDGKTALFCAVEHNSTAGIDILLENSDINLNLMDGNKRTVLDIAVGRRKFYLNTFKLLKKKANPTVDLGYKISELLLTSATGDIKKMRELLKESQVKLNGFDRLGFTALHEAVCFGRYDIADLLIEHKASIAAEIKHGGDTVLHAVIHRGREHRQFFNGDRRTTPPLSSDHVKIVDLLLRKGAKISTRRWLDDLTAYELVSQELKSPQNCQLSQRRFLQQILVILKNQSSRKESPSTPLRPLRPERVDMASQNTDEILRPLELRVQYHTASRRYNKEEMSIMGFLSKETGKGSVRNELPVLLRKLEDWAKKLKINDQKASNQEAHDQEAHDQEAHEHWRWIHLPANNKSWIEDVIEPLSDMDSTTLKPYASGLRRFIDRSYHEIRGPAPYARSRETCFTSFTGSHGDTCSIVVPYFDSECFNCLLGEHGCSSDQCRQDFARQQELKRLYNNADDNPTILHLPRTLDQSYYPSLTTNDRDKDQIVVKYAARHKKLPKLLMVNQMWIWKIDAMTLITTFPDRRQQGPEPKLLTLISESLERDRPLNLDSMINRMLSCAIGISDAPTNAGLDENMFHIFEQSIADRANEEANCFIKFYKAQKMLSDAKQSDEDSMIIEGEMCNISKEVEHLREIKDIKDELKIIQQVLEDQKSIVRPRANGEDIELDNTYNSLERRIRKVKKLSKDASSVEDSLNYLLDLKQKQGNLIVVRDTRSLASEAENRANASSRQNQLLFIFTIITVIFTPLSFISSFLAVPTWGFPRDGEGENIAWRWWQVFLASLITELITFLAVVGWLAPEMRSKVSARLIEWWRRGSDSRDAGRGLP